MKAGDLVKYATNDIEHRVGDFPRTIQRWSGEGLLVSCNLKEDNICEILDNRTGKIVRKHIIDVKFAYPERRHDERR